MTTFDTGRQAEVAAADFLRHKGCEILAQNWRTRWCEIDIVSQRSGIVYFCEVKYRATNRQGAGLDYITPQKLQKMRLAAQAWTHAHRWSGPIELVAIEVSGPKFQITAVIKDLE